MISSLMAKKPSETIITFKLSKQLAESMNAVTVLAAPAAYILTDLGGGESYWSYMIMKSLAPFNVKYIALVDEAMVRYPLPNVLIKELGKNGVKKLTSKMTNVDKLRFISTYSKNVVKILKDSKYRINILHHILPFGYERTFNPLLLLGYARGYPFIIGPVPAPHQALTDKNAAKFPRFLIPICNVLFKKTLGEVDKLLVVSEYAKKCYKKYLSTKRIVVLTPGVDTELFTPSNLVKGENGCYEILAVGFLTKRKGFDFLIKAMPYILSCLPKTKLRIIGNGPDKHRLQGIANKLGLVKKVIFQGFVCRYELPNFYRKSDIFCLPALSETWVVLLEAMACGIPVITTSIGSSADFVEDGKNGFLVKYPPDPKEIADAILKSLLDDELRRRMSSGARKTAKRYNWKTFAKTLWHIYSTI